MVVNGSKKTSQNEPDNFCCIKCSYSTHKYGNWKRHLQTVKHKRLEMVVDGIEKGAKTSQDIKEELWECECGKKYKYNTGYYRHKRTCNYFNNNQIIELNNKLNDIQNKMQNQSNNNQQNEIINTLLTQMTQLTNAITTVVPLVGNQTHTNSHNNQFNINLYLNETCKDALSIQAFAERLSIELSDMDGITRNDPKLIGEIVNRNLECLSQVERPLHTHKKKWYVKNGNDGWDNNINNAVAVVKRGIGHQALPHLEGLYPNWRDPEHSDSYKYAQAMSATIGDATQKYKKGLLEEITDNCAIDN